MDGIPPLRQSRLQPPTTFAMQELSESQHNMRSAIPAPKGIKREVAPPAPQSQPKRKNLSEIAAEYPTKPAAAPRPIKGQSLTSISQLKPPTSIARPPSNLAKSFGPRNDRPARPNHARSKSQARPRTAHGLREEEEEETSNGTDPGIACGASSDPSKSRESSLVTRFSQLSLSQATPVGTSALG
ncbi:hypothetical protein B0I35DRAFT_482302 [Stachybotrys elegans]|uniref:Uncharacterized protein n=1 Tax=Stachybotrys elegans TaxID=80388 RepID=A0A8K0WMF9_9HYPO|nr:hypothetical protein B0I35DRAFT_482302 [Stachybotrys elegans]